MDPPNPCCCRNMRRGVILFSAFEIIVNALLLVLTVALVYYGVSKVFPECGEGDCGLIYVTLFGLVAIAMLRITFVTGISIARVTYLRRTKKEGDKNGLNWLITTIVLQTILLVGFYLTTFSKEIVWAQVAASVLLILYQIGLVICFKQELKLRKVRSPNYYVQPVAVVPRQDVSNDVSRPTAPPLHVVELPPNYVAPPEYYECSRISVNPSSPSLYPDIRHNNFES